MQRLFLLSALPLLISAHTALADPGERMALDGATDDCALYQALNGSNALPEECQDDSKGFPYEQEANLPPVPVILQRVNFDLDSNALTPAARIDLARIAKVMSDPVSHLQVYRVGGHTDSLGDPAYNQALSERRASATRRYLIALGVPPSRLVARGYGARELLDSVPSYDPANRRVEVVNQRRRGNL